MSTFIRPADDDRWISLEAAPASVRRARAWTKANAESAPSKASTPSRVAATSDMEAQRSPAAFAIIFAEPHRVQLRRHVRPTLSRRDGIGASPVLEQNGHHRPAAERRRCPVSQKVERATKRVDIRAR